MTYRLASQWSRVLILSRVTNEEYESGRTDFIRVRSQKYAGAHRSMQKHQRTSKEERQTATSTKHYKSNSSERRLKVETINDRIRLKTDNCDHKSNDYQSSIRRGRTGWLAESSCLMSAFKLLMKSDFCSYRQAIDLHWSPALELALCKLLSSQDAILNYPL